MDQLRVFRNQQVLRVAASDVTGQFPIAEVSNQLTYIAEACIQTSLRMAWDDLVRRHGAPTCTADSTSRTAGFAIIGYGKLGGWELGYGSDLDVVFLHDSAGVHQQTAGPKVIENDVFFARLVQRFIHLLSTTTGAGVAYEVDTPAPSGNAGQVSAVTAYRDYPPNVPGPGNCRPWCARAIAGEAGPAPASRPSAAKRCAPARRHRAAADIVTMRERMLAN